jgi:ATP-dependent protease ClpP protease subunit
VVAGAAVGVAAVSHHRWATAHSSFRLGDPPASAQGSFAELERWAEQLGRVRARFVDRLSRAVGVEPEVLASDLAAGRILDPHQALEAGLVDQVGGIPPEP